MITMLVYDRKRQDLERLKVLSRSIFAVLSEEKLQLHCFSEADAVREYLRGAPLLHLACVRITEHGKQEETDLLRYMRSLYAQTDFLLTADDTISPMEYLTPDIRAASLLLHPYEQEQQKQVIKAFLRDFLEKRGCPEEKTVLVIEGRGGKTAIPFQQIYFIEVRERKVFIRLKTKEYSQYGSMDSILKKLPDTFLRCHRSFAFNTQHLDTVKLSENAIYLEHGMMVPLSRSYKSIIKEYINGLREA